MSVGKLCTCLACEKMNYCLTCILPEMGCCVSGLVPIKNICVNHVARATDRTKVSADVIQLAAHEKDPSPETGDVGRYGQTDVCSSRLAIIVMAVGRATSVC